MSTKKRSRRGTIVFYAIYFVLLAAALSAAVVGLGKLWEFLQRYEACQIYHITDAAAAELNSGKLDLLYAAVEGDISPYEDEEALHRQIRERYSGEFSFKKSVKESAKDSPVYTMLCAGEPMAYIGLTQTSEDPVYGFGIYSITRAYGIVPEKNESVTVTVPTGCGAEINGKPLTEYAEKSSVQVEGCENFGDYLQAPPQYATYTVDGLMYQPQVGFTDGSGNKLPADKAQDGSYSCGLPITDSAAAKEAEQFAMEFSELYSKYIANDIYFSSISGYIPEDVKLYGDLQTYEGQFYTYHTGYDFTEEKTVSVQQYSPECFTVRVSYVHNVYYGGETYSYPADNTVYAVSTANGWKAVGLTMN